MEMIYFIIILNEEKLLETKLLFGFKEDQEIVVQWEFLHN